jgi:hypothetical protein
MNHAHAVFLFPGESITAVNVDPRPTAKIGIPNRIAPSTSGRMKIVEGQKNNESGSSSVCMSPLKKKSIFHGENSLSFVSVTLCTACISKDTAKNVSIAKATILNRVCSVDE